MNIKITLPDGSVREVAKGSSALDVAKSISEGLARVIISAKVNDEIWDLTRPIQEDAALSLLKFDDLEKISKGLTIDGHKVLVQEVSYIENEPKSEIGLQLKSPNVKVVRTIFEHLGYDVLRIDRVAFAGLTKKNLPRGNWRFLTEQEIINLKNS